MCSDMVADHGSIDPRKKSAIGDHELGIPSAPVDIGALLFLPVPVVLLLFTRAPFGPLASLGAGVALMVTHRLYARPWALARAGRRCLWCTRPAEAGPELAIEEPFGRTTWRACGDAHADHVRRFLGWAETHGLLLKAGILGTLLLFLIAGPVAALTHLGPIVFADVVAAFKMGIAATVLPLGWLALRRPRADGPLRVPFPVHIQALVGSWTVMWLFRTIGTVWLVQAVLHAWRRFS